MKNIVYDRIIPLGDRCSCTQNLKHYGLRPLGRKLPFDWLKNGGFKERIDILLNDFDDFLNQYRLKRVKYFKPEKWQFHRFYDTKTKLVFAHDFPKNMNFTDGFATVVRTYRERIERWRSYFAAREKILLVYMTDVRVANRELCWAITELRKKYGYDDIDLLGVENGIKTLWRCHQSQIMDGVTKIKARRFLMPTHYKDTTPEQFEILDKIFSSIKVKEDKEVYF